MSSAPIRKEKREEEKKGRRERGEKRREGEWEGKQTPRMPIRDKHCWCILLLAPFFHWWSSLLINGIFQNLPEAFCFPVVTCVGLSVFFLGSNHRQVTLWEEGSEERL